MKSWNINMHILVLFFACYFYTGYVKSESKKTDESDWAQIAALAASKAETKKISLKERFKLYKKQRSVRIEKTNKFFAQIANRVSDLGDKAKKIFMEHLRRDGLEDEFPIHIDDNMQLITFLYPSTTVQEVITKQENVLDESSQIKISNEANESWSIKHWIAETSKVKIGVVALATSPIWLHAGNGLHNVCKFRETHVRELVKLINDAEKQYRAFVIANGDVDLFNKTVESWMDTFKKDNEHTLKHFLQSWDYFNGGYGVYYSYTYLFLEYQLSAVTKRLNWYYKHLMSCADQTINDVLVSQLLDQANNFSNDLQNAMDYLKGLPEYKKDKDAYEEKVRQEQEFNECPCRN